MDHMHNIMRCVHQGRAATALPLLLAMHASGVAGRWLGSRWQQISLTPMFSNVALMAGRMESTNAALSPICS